MYVNDLVIYCKVTIQEAKEVIRFLDTYCNWSGQAINWTKSSVYFSKNVVNQLRGEICRVMSIQNVNIQGNI